MAQSPDEFLVHQYHLDPDSFLEKLYEQAKPRGGVERLLTIHTKTVPAFVDLVRQPLLDLALLRSMFPAS